MAIAFVNSAFSTGSVTAGTTKTISYTPTAGNTLVVFGFGAAAAVINVTDTLGNTYFPYAAPEGSTIENSMWVTAPGHCKGGATTITVTFGSSVRNTVAVIEYSGVLGFGKTNEVAGSSTAPSIAITTQDANNFVVAGLGTIGTSTWTQNNPTLRNSQVGAGATTPGGGLADNTVTSPGAATANATLGTTGAWSAIAIELRSVQQPFADDQSSDYYQNVALPPWRVGILKLLEETEPYDWGYAPVYNLDNTPYDNQPQQRSYCTADYEDNREQWGYVFDTKMSIDNERFDPPPQIMSYTIPEIETEQFDWGFNLPLAGIGSQYMGYSGFWALKPGMGSEHEIVDYSSPQVVTRDDMYIDTWVLTSFTEQDDDQFSYNPVVITILNGFLQDEAPVPVIILVDSSDDVIIDTQFALDADQSPLSLYPVVQSPDEDTSHNTFFALEEYWEDDIQFPKMLLLFASVDTEYEQFMFNPPLAGAGSNLMGFKGFWSLRAAMGSEYEDLKTQPVIPLDEIDQPVQQQKSFALPELETEMEQFMYNPPLAGAGANLMGFRGFWSLKAAMDMEKEFSFNPPVVTVFNAFLQDDILFKPLQSLVDNDEAWGFDLPYQSADEDHSFRYTTQIIADNESEQIYPNAPFLTPIGFDDSLEQYALAWKMLDQIEDSQIYPTAPFLKPISFDDSPEQYTKSLQVFDDVDLVNFVESFVTEDTTQSAQTLTQYQDDEQFSYNPVVITVSNAFNEDQIPLQLSTIVYETEQFDWGFNLPLAGTGSQYMGYSGFWALKPAMGSEYELFDYSTPEVTSKEDSYIDSWQSLLLVEADNESEQFGFNPPVVTVFNAFILDEHQPSQVLYFFDDSDFGYNLSEIVSEINLDEEIQLLNQPRIVVQQVEDDQVYPTAPFLTPIGFDDSPEQYVRSWVMQDDVDIIGFAPVLVDDGSQDRMTPLIFIPDDDLFVYGVLVGPLPTMLYDAELNPAQQLSYYFGSMDTEEFDWGYNPPLTHVSEDDSPYDSFVIASVAKDDIDAQNFVEVFVQDDQPAPLQTVSTPQDDDQLSYNPVVVTILNAFNVDEMLGNQVVMVTQDDDQFSYNPVVVTTLNAFLPDDILVNQVQVQTYDSDDGRVVLEAFASEDDIPSQVLSSDSLQDEAHIVNWFDVLDDVVLQQVLVKDEADQLSQEPVFVVDPDQHQVQNRIIIDDVEQFVSHSPFIPPTSEAWELSGLPSSPPYPYMDDVDTFGYKFPIAYPSHTLEDFQAPQFPVWSLAWSDDDESLLAIPLPPPTFVPILYTLKIVPELQVQCVISPSVSLYDISVLPSMTLGLETFGASGYGIGGYGLGGYGVGGSSTVSSGAIVAFPCMMLYGVKCTPSMQIQAIINA